MKRHRNHDRLTSPGLDRDLLTAALLVTALGLLVAVTAILMLALGLSNLVLSGMWAMPGVGRWITGLVSVVAHAREPGAELGRPWSHTVAQHPAVYWTITATLLTMSTAATARAGVLLWQRSGPVAAGHASRQDIRDELSLVAARRTAHWTRPSLTRTEIAAAPLDEVAAPLHRSPWGEPMGTPLENPSGTLAPTQSGKSRGDLVHKAIGAPGALLCSTTKPDLLEWTALRRAARPGAGPVLVADVTGAVTWPAPLRWPPMHGCEDTAVAYRRAHTMVEAASVSLRDVSGNDKVFRDRAKVVLQAYFLAAAIHDRGVDDLVRWATSKPLDQEPVRLLQQAGHHDYARNLRSEIGLVSETSDAVWLSVRRVIEPFLDKHIRELCMPSSTGVIDMERTIAQNGSLYLVASKQQAAQAAPILTALVEQWLTTAQNMALHTPHRRLDPPATAILDELTTATPVPQLPEIAADSAGRGVLVHWADQSTAAMERSLTPQGFRQLLDNTTTLSVWGGIKDRATLEWVSMLTGHHDRRRYQHQTDGLFGRGRTAVGTETVPTYRPGDVRRIRRRRVLVIHRHLDPILARTVDVKERPDWPAIRQDVEAVRAGNIPLGPDGTVLADPARLVGRSNRAPQHPR